MASDGSIKITTELDSKEAEKALSRFSSIAKTGIKGVSVAVGAVSAALTGTAGYAIKFGIDFESAFAGVKKTVDATDSELAGFRQGIRDMAKEMPQSASQISEVAEAAGQLGIKNKNLLSFTEVMSNLGVATNMSATEAATSLARLANITQMPQENFDRLGSTIVALGNNLATTESEITEMGLRLAGAGKQVGMSENQILGLAGAISSVGIEAEAGGSAVSTVMAKMQLAVEEGGESLEQFADVAGMSASEFQQAFKNDAAQALVSFVTGLGTMESRGKSAISTLSDMEITEIRQRDALLRLAGAGDVLSNSLDIASEAWSENAALTTEAEQRYETLESRLQILKNNAGDLAITFYDGIRDPLKNTVDEGIAYVEELSNAFSAGGLSSAVSAAEVATDVASHAPDMVNSAVQFIQAFASGIYENRGEIVSAAGSIVSALASGIADLLPSSVSVPVKAAIEDISASFESGGLRTAINTVSTLFKNFSTVAGTVAKTVLPPLTKALDLVSGNMKMLVPVVTLGYTAFKTYGNITKTVTAASKAYTVASKALNAMEKANALQLVATNGGLTIQQTLIALRNGQITATTALTGLWTKAQTALNMALSANPIGLAVTALAAGIGAAVLMTDKASESTGKLTEKQKENIESSEEAIKNIEQEAEARQKNIAASTAEIDNAEALWNELSNIVDENGKIKAGYEDRASYITGELASALGVELSVVDGVVQGYQEVEASIQDVIAAKKAEAMLDAMKSDYTTAMQEQAEKASALATEYEKLNELKTEQNELQEEYDELTESLSKTWNDEDAARLSEVNEELAGINGEIEEQQALFDEANAAMQDNQKIISDYNMLFEAVMSGNTETINNALAEIQSGIDTTLSVGSDAAIEQAETTAGTLASVFAGQRDGLYQLETETVNSLGQTMGLALNQAGNGAEAIKAVLASAGEEGAGDMVAAMAQADLDGTLSAEAKAGFDSFVEGFSGLDAATQEKFDDAIQGACNGLSNYEEVVAKADEMGISFLEALAISLDEHSPSKATEEIFELAMEGAGLGVESGKEGVLSKAGEFVSEFLGKFTESGMGETLQNIGSNLMSFFGIGVGSQTGNSQAQGKANADAANAGASSVDPTGTGRTFGDLLGGGIAGMVSFLFGQGQNLSSNADSGAGSINPSSTGQNFGSLFGKAISAMFGYAKAQGTALGSNAESGADSADAYGVGSNFGSGFVSGIGSWIQNAASKAAELAASAYNAAKSWLDEHSPSRKTRKIGKFFSQGLALGIKDEQKIVEKASEKLADTAINSLDLKGIEDSLNELDIDGMIEQIYGAMADTNIRIADKVTAGMEVSDKAYIQRNREKSIFTDEDIKKIGKELGYQFGIVAANKLAENMEGMTMEVYGREFARVVKEAERQ